MIFFITGLLGGIALGIVGTLGVLMFLMRDWNLFPA